MIRDPVCGAEFTEEEASSLGAERTDGPEGTVWFCCASCKETWLRSRPSR